MRYFCEKHSFGEKASFTAFEFLVPAPCGLRPNKSSQRGLDISYLSSLKSFCRMFRTQKEQQHSKSVDVMLCFVSTSLYILMVRLKGLFYERSADFERKLDLRYSNFLVCCRLRHIPRFVEMFGHHLSFSPGYISRKCRPTEISRAANGLILYYWIFRRYKLGTHTKAPQPEMSIHTATQ